LIDARQLHLDDHPEHRVIVDEKDDRVGAELSRNDLGQVG